MTKYAIIYGQFHASNKRGFVCLKSEKGSWSKLIFPAIRRLMKAVYDGPTFDAPGDACKSAEGRLPCYHCIAALFVMTSEAGFHCHPTTNHAEAVKAKRDGGTVAKVWINGAEVWAALNPIKRKTPATTTPPAPVKATTTTEATPEVKATEATPPAPVPAPDTPATVAPLPVTVPACDDSIIRKRKPARKRPTPTP